jgi:hypothetical protein
LIGFHQTQFQVLRSASSTMQARCYRSSVSIWCHCSRQSEHAHDSYASYIHAFRLAEATLELVACTGYDGCSSSVEKEITAGRLVGWFQRVTVCALCFASSRGGTLLSMILVLIVTQNKVILSKCVGCQLGVFGTFTTGAVTSAKKSKFV